MHKRDDNQIGDLNDLRSNSPTSFGQATLLLQTIRLSKLRTATKAKHAPQ